MVGFSPLVADADEEASDDGLCGVDVEGCGY